MYELKEKVIKVPKIVEKKIKVPRIVKKEYDVPVEYYEPVAVYEQNAEKVALEREKQVPFKKLVGATNCCVCADDYHGSSHGGYAPRASAYGK